MLKFLIALVALFVGFALCAQTANDRVPAYNADFGQGINFGWYENWTDEDLARLSTGTPDGRVPGIGVNALRPGLFGWFLEQFGYDIRAQTFETYRSLGAVNNVVILGFPSDQQRGTEEWCNGQRSQLFRGLYEPIWDDNNGTPYNEANSYAAYVYKLVQVYKNNVRFYEIWNEPDIGSSGNGWKDRRYEGNWFDNNIDPCELTMKAPVQAYVRMLRISYEIIHRLDPDSYVAIGGVGYPSFLDAVLRSTDEPTQGKVTANYPLGGGAYFDALSFHVYPHLEEGFRDWDNTQGRWAWKRHSDAAINGIETKFRNFQTVLQTHGYDGSRFPAKVTLCTESNIPRQHFYEEASARSSVLMQRNFILKALAHMQEWGVSQFHPYQLADTKHPGSATGEFDLMGFYEFINDDANFAATQRTETGIAYGTYGTLLRGASYDEALTDALNLPAAADGVAFRLPSGKSAYLLWARTSQDGNEYPSLRYTLTGELAAGNHDFASWDYSATGAHQPLRGAVTLTGEPIFVLHKDDFSSPNNTHDSASQIDLRMWPNPASSVLSIELPAAVESWKISITDALGREIPSSSVPLSQNPGRVDVDVSALAMGNYQLRLVGAEGQVVKGFVVVR